MIRSWLRPVQLGLRQPLNLPLADGRQGMGRVREGDCALLFPERSWTADERTVPEIKPQEPVRIPRYPDLDALPDFAKFVIAASEP